MVSGCTSESDLATLVHKITNNIAIVDQLKSKHMSVHLRLILPASSALHAGRSNLAGCGPMRLAAAASTVSAPASLLCRHHSLLISRPTLPLPAAASLRTTQASIDARLLLLRRSLPVPLSHRRCAAFSSSSTSSAASSPAQPEHTVAKKSVERKENIYTAANALTVSRIFMTPFIGYLIIQQSFTYAFGLLTIAAFTDLFDGILARQFNQKTFLGSALDPAADKILMTTLVIALCQAGLLPVYLAALILGRDIFLILGTAYYRYITLAPPKTVARYFDLSLPSAEVRPPMISKINTLLQLVLMGLSLAMPVFDFLDPSLLLMLQYTVAITTVWSGMHYVLSKDVIKVLK
eukprot:jgi/Hompol1/5776/HPOL_002059-RA